MKSFVTRISYKMLITTMITILLSFFVATSCAHANKFSDLVNEDGIYYTGTQDAKVSVKGGIFDKIINALSQIANYLLGLMTLGTRAVFIGWIEVGEMILTWILDIDNSLDKVNTDSMDVYAQKTVNVESILFNRVPILNANIFETASVEYDANKTEQETDADKIAKNDEIVPIIRNAVAKWYYILRLIAIAFMLLVLIFVGIKMVLSTVASEKAVYKQMLIDWVAGMIIVFTIHYIMISIFAINDAIVNGLQALLAGNNEIQLEEYQYGLDENGKVESKTFNEMETTLYESARTRAYSLSLTDGFTGLIIYGVLVYYAWRFAIKYFIRVFNIMILTIVAPVISASYALNKVMTGKSKIFSGWLTEYVINVIIQLFHVIIYVSFVSIALKLSAESLPGAILAFVLLHFMLESEKLLRTLFKMSGGKGSLSGEMDRVGIQEVKAGIKNLPDMMIGGATGKKLMKATYRVATKPARAIAETAFGSYMAKKANEKEEEERKEEEARKRLEEEIQNLQENKKGVEARKQHFDEEYNKAMSRKKTQKNQKQLSSILEKQKRANADLELINSQLEERLEEQKDFEEIKKLENLQKTFAEGTLEGTIANLFDPKQYATKGADGKYHRMKTLRKGGVKGAFWRKKVDSIGMRFMENAKLKNILNLSSEEVKELKNYYKITKSNVVGFAAGIVGFPALVVNPTLGIALLGQAGMSGMRMATKRRQIKNRPSYKKSKSYNFIDFNKNAKYTMQVEAARQIQEIEQTKTEEVKGKHKNFVRKLLHNSVHAITLPDLDPIESETLAELSYSKYTKQFKTALKQLNDLETSKNVEDFKNKFAEEEQNQKDLAEQMSEEELLHNEYANDDNVVAIGNTYFGIDLDNSTEQTEKKFVDNAEKKMSEQSNASRAERLNAIKYDLRNNQQKLIQNQIQKYFARRGITDINNTKMESSDTMQIKANILALLEEKGIIKKGEIKADEFISTENVQNAYQNLQNNQNKTNEGLELILATDTVLEYMRQTGITDKNELSQRADEIYDLMKDKMMSEDSKKSADVIRQLSGQDKKKEEIDVSDYMKEAVGNGIKKVKKVKKTKNKKDLVEHETNRRMNAVKNQLEQALYADTVEDIDSQNVLDLLFALSKIGENNREAIEVNGKTQGRLSQEQQGKLDFYQDGTRRLDQNRDGSKRFDQTRDGSQRVVEELFMETKKQALTKRIAGSDVNLMDLLNNV